MEGLFRNGINPDIEKDLIVMIIRAKILSENSEVPTIEGNYKILFNNTSDGIKDILVVKYENQDIENSKIVELKAYRREDEAIHKSENSLKKMIISSLWMYATNSSRGISSALKEIDNEFMLNKEMVNNDKKELLDKYKKYLEQKNNYDKKIKEMKKNGASITEISAVDAPVSPLLSENEEERKNINKMMNGPLYNDNKMVKLVKEGKEFFWMLETNKIQGKFKNDTHQMKYLKINDVNGEINIIPDDYVTYQGEYSLPKKLHVTENDLKLEFEVVNYYLVNSTSKDFNKRIEEYSKQLDKKSSGDDEAVKNQYKELGKYFL